MPVHESPGVYRERVYCYELYHQLRLRWPSDCPYRLNGEIDKRGHPYFADDGWSPKPDFLIHVPGSGDNLLIIEVKTADSLQRRDVLKDLDTLHQFIRRAGYRRAMHLVFGAAATETMDALSRAGLDRETFPEVEFWGHSKPGLPAEPLAAIA